MGKSGAGETLFNVITNLLFTGKGVEARKNNFMGISTDGAAKMLSPGQKSLAS